MKLFIIASLFFGSAAHAHIVGHHHDHDAEVIQIELIEYKEEINS
jgi:hypothetical protein|tara:strand:+ start:46 stop:180 length:135 start_codon:yes stop_codon:yes gene_type:complete